MPADAARAGPHARRSSARGWQEGAVGLSSGLDYPPGSYATTEELAALTEEAGRHGGFYHTHVRYALGDRYLDPFREAIEIGRRAGAPAHITHFYHRETHPGGPEPLLGLVDDARAEGLDVTFDSLSRPSGRAPGSSSSSRTGSRPAAPARSRSASPNGPRATASARSSRPAALPTPSPAGWADVRLGAFRQPENLRWEARTLADVMDETGHDAVDAICDLLLAENLAVNQVTSGPWTETLRPFVAHPVGMVGTDSHVRRREAEPADLRQLPAHPRPVRPRRGAAQPRGGDPQDDLGAGGPARPARPRDARATARSPTSSSSTRRRSARPPRTTSRAATRSASRHVIVNGTLVVDDGVHTGATPGRGIRLGRD